MGENTKISWPHHTFNPVRGCEHESPGCDNCYAESGTKRFGLQLWGPTNPRLRTSKENWKKPTKWNEEARKTNTRFRVFCASQSDVGEDHPDWIEARRDLARLIEETQHLDWLLLTKRPQNMRRLFSDAGWTALWPENVWVGATVENPDVLENRILELVQIPARVRFLSLEPLLGPLEIGLVGTLPGSVTGGAYVPVSSMIHWVIVGGESGPRARTFDLQWARQLRDECALSETPFFFKQTGQNAIDSSLVDIDLGNEKLTLSVDAANDPKYNDYIKIPHKVNTRRPQVRTLPCGQRICGFNSLCDRF